MGVKFNPFEEKQKKIPEEFKDLAKDFAEKIGKGEVEIKHDSDTETAEKSPY